MTEFNKEIESIIKKVHKLSDRTDINLDISSAIFSLESFLSTIQREHNKNNKANQALLFHELDATFQKVRYALE